MPARRRLDSLAGSLVKQAPQGAEWEPQTTKEPGCRNRPGRHKHNAYQYWR
jgi:hypothetical protein